MTRHQLILALLSAFAFAFAITTGTASAGSVSHLPALADEVIANPAGFIARHKGGVSVDAEVLNITTTRTDDGGQIGVVQLSRPGDARRNIGTKPFTVVQIFCGVPLEEAAKLKKKQLVRVELIPVDVEQTQETTPLMRADHPFSQLTVHTVVAMPCRFGGGGGQAAVSDLDTNTCRSFADNSELRV